MKKRLSFSKASRMFILAFALLFVFSFSVSAQNTGCCALTDKGAYCDDNAKKTNCKSDKYFAEGVQSCDNAGFSQGYCEDVACAIDSNNFECSTPSKIKADEENYLEERSSQCSQIKQCQTGCCIINGEGDWENRQKCKYDTRQAGIAEMNFTQDFAQVSDDEDYCENEFHKQGQYGACVEGSSCKYVQRKACSSGEFSAGEYCSEVMPEKYVEGNQGCSDKFPEDIYNFDSAGNREDVAKECPQNHVCSIDDEGEPYCRSLNCESIEKPDGSTVTLENGESTCFYDGSGSGMNGFSSPGSTSWKVACSRGEIEKVNCGIGRSEICVGGSSQQRQTGGEESKAFCIPNRGEECLKITSDYYSKMNEKASQIFEDASSNQEKENIAERDELRDRMGEILDEMSDECNKNFYCTYRSSGHAQKNSLGAMYDISACLPKFPEASPDATNNLNHALDRDAKILFKKAAYAYQVAVNSELVDDQKYTFFNTANRYCTMAGDFGVDYNYLGSAYSDSGFSYSPTEKESFESTFARKTRKEYIPDAIWPHENNNNDPGWCDASLFESAKKCDFNFRRLVESSSILDLSFYESARDTVVEIANGKVSSPTDGRNLDPSFGPNGVPNIGESTRSGDRTGTGSKSSSESSTENKTLAEILNIPSGGLKENPGSMPYGPEYSEIMFNNPEMDAREALRKSINEYHDKEYGYLSSGEDLSERSDKTWGWNSPQYMRHIQKDKGQDLKNNKLIRDKPGRVKNIEIGYQCKRWQPPSTENVDCGKCSSDGTPCTEYQCNSISSACRFINQSTMNPRCIQIKNDGDAPTVENIEYNGTDAELSGSGNDEWSLSGGNCVPERSSFEIDLEMDEFARCKYGMNVEPDTEFSSLPNNPEVTGNGFRENHTFKPQIPNLATIMDDNYGYNKQKDLNLTIKCRDVYENPSEAWTINYCASTGPDEDPPQFLDFSPENEKSWEYNPDSFGLDLKLDEGSYCNYQYNNPINKFNISAQNTKRCSGGSCTIPVSVQDPEKTNHVYLACNDSLSNNYGSGNVETEHYKYKIKRDMNLSEYKKEHGLKMEDLKWSFDEELYSSGETIATSQTPAEIKLIAETSGGVNNGASNCTLGSSQGLYNRKFSGDMSKSHETPFELSVESTQKSYVKCTDGVTNVTEQINFTLDIDRSAPQIVSNSTEEGGDLTITTDEPAQCSYSPGTCDFEIQEGEAFDFGSSDNYVTNQSVPWNPNQTYNIKCRDELGNVNSGCAGKINPRDANGPRITRIWEESGELNVRTDRDAKCYFDFNGCGFNILQDPDNGMSGGSLSREHSADWNPSNTYHIKCKDQWGNPNPSCSAIVQPHSL